MTAPCFAESFSLDRLPVSLIVLKFAILLLYLMCAPWLIGRTPAET